MAWRLVNHSRRHFRRTFRGNGIRNDPVENTPEYKRVEAEVDRKVREAFIAKRLKLAKERVDSVYKEIEQAKAQVSKDDRYYPVLKGWKSVLAEADEDLAFVEETIRTKSTDEAFSQLQEFGSIHIIWGIRQKILLEEYGIRWRPPSEMNPDVFID